MSELKVIDVDKMADVRSLSGQFYRKYEVDEVIAKKDAKILALDAEVFKQKHHAELFLDERNYAETQLRHYKSEADKVIADLEESHKKEVGQLLIEIVELKADYKEACDRLQTANLIKDEQLAATRHQKYKRCLAMAKWCRSESLWWYSKGYGFEKYDKFWEKWEKRWMELAEKFKEAK